MNDSILQFIILAPPLFLALTVHEFAHGYVAFRLGDPTAQREGRLTLNPLKHLDPLGTIAFFIFHFICFKVKRIEYDCQEKNNQKFIWILTGSEKDKRPWYSGYFHTFINEITNIISLSF